MHYHYHYQTSLILKDHEDDDDNDDNNHIDPLIMQVSRKCLKQHDYSSDDIPRNRNILPNSEK